MRRNETINPPTIPPAHISTHPSEGKLRGSRLQLPQEYDQSLPTTLRINDCIDLVSPHFASTQSQDENVSKPMFIPPAYALDKNQPPIEMHHQSNQRNKFVSPYPLSQQHGHTSSVPPNSLVSTGSHQPQHGRTLTVEQQIKPFTTTNAVGNVVDVDKDGLHYQQDGTSAEVTFGSNSFDVVEEGCNFHKNNDLDGRTKEKLKGSPKSTLMEYQYGAMGNTLNERVGNAIDELDGSLERHQFESRKRNWQFNNDENSCYVQHQRWNSNSRSTQQTASRNWVQMIQRPPINAQQENRTELQRQLISQPNILQPRHPSRGPPISPEFSFDINDLASSQIDSGLQYSLSPSIANLSSRVLENTGQQRSCSGITGESRQGVYQGGHSVLASKGYSHQELDYGQRPNTMRREATITAPLSVRGKFPKRLPGGRRNVTPRNQEGALKEIDLSESCEESVPSSKEIGIQVEKVNSDQNDDCSVEDSEMIAVSGIGIPINEDNRYLYPKHSSSSKVIIKCNIYATGDALTNLPLPVEVPSRKSIIQRKMPAQDGCGFGRDIRLMMKREKKAKQKQHIQSNENGVLCELSNDESHSESLPLNEELIGSCDVESNKVGNRSDASIGRKMESVPKGVGMSSQQKQPEDIGLVLDTSHTYDNEFASTNTPWSNTVTKSRQDVKEHSVTTRAVWEETPALPPPKGASPKSGRIKRPMTQPEIDNPIEDGEAKQERATSLKDSDERVRVTVKRRKSEPDGGSCQMYPGYNDSLVGSDGGIVKERESTDDQMNLIENKHRGIIIVQENENNSSIRGSDWKQDNAEALDEVKENLRGNIDLPLKENRGPENHITLESNDSVKDLGKLSIMSFGSEERSMEMSRLNFCNRMKQVINQTVQNLSTESRDDYWVLRILNTKALDDIDVGLIPQAPILYGSRNLAERWVWKLDPFAFFGLVTHVSKAILKRLDVEMSQQIETYKKAHTRAYRTKEKSIINTFLKLTLDFWIMKWSKELCGDRFKVMKEAIAKIRMKGFEDNSEMKLQKPFEILVKESVESAEQLKKAWECAQRLMSKYNLTMPSIENEEILESNKGADSNKRRASLFLSSESDTPQPLPISEMQKASNFPAMHQRLKSGSTPTLILDKIKQESQDYHRAVTTPRLGTSSSSSSSSSSISIQSAGIPFGSNEALEYHENSLNRLMKSILEDRKGIRSYSRNIDSDGRRKSVDDCSIVHSGLKDFIIKEERETRRLKAEAEFYEDKLVSEIYHRVMVPKLVLDAMHVVERYRQCRKRVQPRMSNLGSRNLTSTSSLLRSENEKWIECPRCGNSVEVPERRDHDGKILKPRPRRSFYLATNEYGRHSIVNQTCQESLNNNNMVIDSEENSKLNQGLVEDEFSSHEPTIPCFCSHCGDHFSYDPPAGRWSSLRRSSIGSIGRRRLSLLSLNLDDDCLNQDEDFQIQKAQCNESILDEKLDENKNDSLQRRNDSSYYENGKVNDKSYKRLSSPLKNEYNIGKKMKENEVNKLVLSSNSPLGQQSKENQYENSKRRPSIFDTPRFFQPRILRHRQTIDVWNRFNNN